jgi:hypothetical protein
MPGYFVREKFLKFAYKYDFFEEQEEKIVFVLPVYEMKNGYTRPIDKNDLISKIQDKIIRPFHNAVSTA